MTTEQHHDDDDGDAGASARGCAPSLGQRAVWPLLALAVILIVDGFISPGFFTVRIVEGRLFGSVIDIFYRAVPPALVALGMAVVIGTKGIDLSVGSVIAIVGAMIAWRIHAGDPHFVILLIALGAGLSVRRVERVAGRRARHPADHRHADPDGRRPRHRPDDQPDLWRHQSELREPVAAGPERRPYRPDPDAAILVRRDLRALWLLIRRTALGLFLESVGGNAAAANLAGINARLIKYSAYLISGLCAGWAGVILTADTHTSDPVSVALFSELDAILAVVIGGGSLAGGRIYLGMTLIGALIIQALTTSILMSGLPPEYNLLVKAVVVLFVLLLQSNNLRNAVVSLFRRRKA